MKHNFLEHPALADHANIVTSKALPLEEWEAADRPACWVLQESLLVNGTLYRAWFDTGYGNVLLTWGNDNNFVDVGRHAVFGGDHEVVLLDKDHYGLHKYLWK